MTKKRIGLTTTVPHEIIVAAGCVPVDLNNVFISAADRLAWLERAENEGFPAGICAWIKGIYAAVRAGCVDAVVTVLTGDCANTRALAEVLRHRGVATIPFDFPSQPEPAAVRQSLEDLARRFAVSLEQAERVRRQWIPVRRDLAELDRLADEEGRVRSAELHQWLVSASDFNGDAERFAAELSGFLVAVARRPALPPAVRLALLGVPPIFENLFEALEERGAQVVFDEMPRQFAMPYECKDLIEQFCRYTYPYDSTPRLADLRREVGRRRVRAALHYLQAFCHRQIEHIIIRESLPVPVLALEGDRPGPLTGQTLTRLDAFLEMLL